MIDATGLARVVHVWRGVDCGSEEWTVDAFFDSDEPESVKDAFLDLLALLGTHSDRRH